MEPVGLTHRNDKVGTLSAYRTGTTDKNTIFHLTTCKVNTYKVIGKVFKHN